MIATSLIPSVASVGLTMACLSTSYAGVIFSVEAPGVQTTPVVGAGVENFNSAPLGLIGGGGYASAGVDGVYTGGQVIPPDVWGGAGGAGQYAVVGLGVSSSQTLQFNAGKTYFGMWWSAGDINNQLQIFGAGNSLLASYAIGDIIPLLSPAYFGNPNGGGNGGEAYAYLNFTTTGGDLMDHIVFNQIGGGGGFETDNHSSYGLPIDPPGTILPEPGHWAMMGLTLIGVAGYAVRRQRAAMTK
jgi:hypothetical protein